MNFLTSFFLLITLILIAGTTSSLFPCPPAYTFTSELGNASFGTSVSDAGDVNNDGYDDFIVGAPGFYTNPGYAFVYSGKDGATLYTLTPEHFSGFFGYAVSGAGDVNYDGFDDLIVGAIFDGGPGRVYVYSGQSGLLLYTFDGEMSGDWFGSSVSGVGDVNKDGYDDVVIGAPKNDAGGLSAGRVYVYSGQHGNLLNVITGKAAFDNFGSSVSGVGDVNNDGFVDLIVGAFGNDAGGNGAGKAYVYSAQAGQLLYTFTGEAAGDFFGRCVSGAGDVNNDGFDDLIVGAPQNGPGGNDRAGRAYVYSGQSGLLLYTFTGEATGDLFGCSVSGAGDVNNDGFSELIVGAQQNDEGGNNAGRVYLFSGQNGGLLETFTGEVSSDLFGFSVSGAGNVNGDSFEDLLVGAYGKIYVYLGGPCIKSVILDVKPGSCDNPLNVNNNGNHGQRKSVFPAAIIGSIDFDVHDIDPTSVTINGISVVRWNYEDVEAPADKSNDDCACSTAGPDGIMDLTMKFYSEDVVVSLGNGNAVIVEGQLKDGTSFEGKDCVTLVRNSDGKNSISDREAQEVIQDFELLGNYPNPFNPTTQISFYLPEKTNVKLEIFNMLGQSVATLVDGEMESGEQLVTWEAGDVSSGIYYYRLTAGDRFATSKMLLLK